MYNDIQLRHGVGAQEWRVKHVCLGQSVAIVLGLGAGTALAASRWPVCWVVGSNELRRRCQGCEAAGPGPHHRHHFV